MQGLGELRRKMTITLVAIGCVAVAAVGILLSPLVGSSESRRAELTGTFRELNQKTREVEPLRGLDKKITLSNQQISEFYRDRLPGQDSAISEELGKLASQNGVRVSQVKYAAKDPEPVGLRPVVIEADLTGDYLQLVRFINALERDKLFFIVDSVELGGEQGGQVKLGMKLETYLKAGA